MSVSQANHNHVRDMAYIALSAALMTVCSWISIPVAIPFTLQTFAMCVAGGLLGAKRGTAAVGVYLLLGLVGAPVFAGFTGGAGILTGATGGYLVGFLFTALAAGITADRFGRGILPLAVGMVIGVALCYAFGTAWFMAVYARASGPIGILTALGWCVFPFLLPDLAKIALALGASRLLGRSVH